METNKIIYSGGIIFLCLLLFIIIFSPASSADVIYLKNGQKMEGTIEKQDAEKIYLKIKLGIIGISRNQIDRIEKTVEKIAGEGKEIETEKEIVKEDDSATKKKFEEEQMAEGKVKYKDRWVTPEEKAILELPKIKISNRRIYKDGKLFFIKGIDYSVNYPKMTNFSDIPRTVWEKDFKMIKELGVNTIRTYHPLPPELLDLAEENELMVIEAVVSPNSETNYNSPEELKKLTDEAVRIVKRDKLRKCILMWAIWNDAPFHWEKGGNSVERYGMEKVNGFLGKIYTAVKKEDKNHPVTASNMLDLPGSNLGFDFLDAIGINAFIGIAKETGWFEGIYTQEKARNDIEKLKEISEKYNKPVYIAETGYSTFCRSERQDKIIREQIVACGDELPGVIIFEWADEWWKAGNPAVQDNNIEEHWGITDAYRKPKPGYEAVSEMFKSIRTESKGYVR